MWRGAFAAPASRFPVLLCASAGALCLQMNSPKRRGGRPQKSLQLCAQVFDALSFALGETTDPILLDLVLDRVEPLHGDAHLLVVFHDPARHGLTRALAALDHARGFLRSAVAEHVHRSKAPQLSFTVAPPPDPGGGDPGGGP